MISEESGCIGGCLNHLAVVSVHSRQVDRLADEVLEDLHSPLSSLLQDLPLPLQTITDTKNRTSSVQQVPPAQVWSHDQDDTYL